MQYVVRFDFPEEQREAWAGLAPDGITPGVAPTIATAKIFTDKDEATRWANYSYGPELTKAAIVEEYHG